MADNDITITVDAQNRTTAAFGAAARGANTVGDAVQNANRSFREADQRYQQASTRLQQLSIQQRRAHETAHGLARELDLARYAAASMGDTTELTARRLRDLAEQQRVAALRAASLTHQHRSQTEQVNDLARAYQRAQRNAQEALRAQLMFGAGTRLDRNGNVIFDRRSNRLMPDDGEQGSLLRLLATLPGMGGFIARASGGAAGAAGAATGNPIIGTALLGGGAALAALLAPLLGGAVTGAIGAGIGTGGVGLGIAGAIANDPEEFRKRWDKVIQDVTGRWVAASASWMEPVKGSIDEVDRALRKLPIESILSNSAGYLDPLTKGATGFVSGLAGGLDALVKDVGPIMEMLGTRLPKLGRDFGDFFASLGEGAEGGAEALDDLLAVVGNLTKMVGTTLVGLSKMYDVLSKDAAMVEHFAGQFTTWLGGLAEHVPVLDRVADRVKQIGESMTADKGAVELDVPQDDGTTAYFRRITHEAEEAVKAMNAYLETTQKLLDTAMADKNAGLALSKGWIELNKELSEGTRTLDLNTKAGIENQAAIVAQIAAAERARQAQIELTGDVGMANQMFDANIERIRQMAYQLGYDKQQVDALIASLQVLNVTNAAPKVELTGAKAAMDQGIALGAILNNLNHTYTAKVQVVPGPGVSLGNALHHPIGGPTSPGMSVINDWGGRPASQGGGELVSLPTGSMVYGGAAAAGGQGGAMAAGGQGGPSAWGGLTLTINSGGSRMDDLLVEIIRSSVSAQGGRAEVLGLKSGR